MLLRLGRKHLGPPDERVPEITYEIASCEHLEDLNLRLLDVTSWDELVVNLFITSRNVYTLPRKIWDGIQDNINPSVAAVATLLILITLIAMLVRQWQQHRAE